MTKGKKANKAAPRIDERPDLIDPPDFLDDVGRSYWFAVVDQVQRYDLESKTNPLLVGIAAARLSSWDRAERQLVETDLTYESLSDQGTTIKADPIVEVTLKLQREAVKLLKLLGLIDNATEEQSIIGRLRAAVGDADGGGD